MAIKNVNYGALIQNAANKYGVDPELIQSVIQVESSGRPHVASGTGPVGLMQVSEALAKDYGYNLNDRLDPAKNIDMGTRYLAQNLKAFGGDVSKALYGYNQGTGGARQQLSGKIPMKKEGINYVNNPAFQKFTGTAGVPNTVHSIANPVAALEAGKPEDTYSPALIQRDAALAAPNQAQAMAGQATPITAQQANNLPSLEPTEEDTSRDHWGDAALAMASMFAPKQTQNSETWSTPSVGRANWNPETQRVMQLLNRVSSAPNFGGGMQ